MRRPQVAGVLLLASLMSVGAQGSGQQSTDPQRSVTPPRPLHQVKPAYTAEALRARIEGAVVLECVVQGDGTVGDVRILRSLDPGLDQEAVKAAKQWRFSPATKQGTPVPVAVTIELAFHVESRLPKAPAWPALFNAGQEVAIPNEAWIQETTETAGVQLRFAYPTGWTVSKASSLNQWFSAHNGDASRLLIVGRPRVPEPQDPDPRSPDAPLQLRDAITRRLTAMGSKARLNATGRVETANRMWLWYDISSTGNDPAMASVAGHFSKGLDGIRGWWFMTGDGATAIDVVCVVLRARGAPYVDAQDEAKAGAEFAAMLRRMSITITP